MQPASCIHVTTPALRNALHFRVPAKFCRQKYFPCIMLRVHTFSLTYHYYARTGMSVCGFSLCTRSNLSLSSPGPPSRSAHIHTLQASFLFGRVKFFEFRKRRPAAGSSQTLELFVCVRTKPSSARTQAGTYIYRGGGRQPPAVCV